MANTSVSTFSKLSEFWRRSIEWRWNPKLATAARIAARQSSAMMASLEERSDSSTIRRSASNSAAEA